MLDRIDDFLAQRSAASQELWDVLTALRGPDNVSHEAKNSTTVHIRQRALPVTARSYFANGAQMQPESLNTGRLPEFGDGVEAANSSHFSQHVMRAWFVLCG